MKYLRKNFSKILLLRFKIRGPEVSNALPTEIRNLDTSMENFKHKLDDFLSLLPDSPRIDEGCNIYCNTLDHVIKS